MSVLLVVARCSCILILHNILANRFAGVALEDLTGQIYSLCKDQHGCRYLQKKLEEQNEKHIALIFNEVFSHFAELMTGIVLLPL